LFTFVVVSLVVAVHLQLYLAAYPVPARLTETLPLFTFVVVSLVVAVHLQLYLAANLVPSRLTETLPLFTFVVVSLVVAVHLQLYLAAYSVPSRLTKALPGQLVGGGAGAVSVTIPRTPWTISILTQKKMVTNSVFILW
jgi:hypothetical protein